MPWQAEDGDVPFIQRLRDPEVRHATYQAHILCPDQGRVAGGLQCAGRLHCGGGQRKRHERQRAAPLALGIVQISTANWKRRWHWRYFRGHGRPQCAVLHRTATSHEAG